MVVLRRKALILFGCCLVLLFLGIFAYQAQQGQALQAMGETVGVVVASKDIRPWVPVTAGDLAVHQVPRRYADPHQVKTPDELVGRMLSVAIPAGSGIPTYIIYTGMDLPAGDRTWELRQGGNVVLDSRIQPGDRVDVMAAVAKSGQESVQHIISGARVLAVQGKDKDFTIVLAVSLDQGKSLMEAENFAKQVRAVRDPLAWAPGGGKP